MHARTLRTVLAALFTIFIVSLGCEKSTSSGGGGSGEIKIGHYGSMTGNEATFGVSTDNGIKLAVKQKNAAG
ncbi:MAG: ethanolamine utilization protein EutJ, partial [Tepidisphaeraceae bacterium]